MSFKKIHLEILADGKLMQIAGDMIPANIPGYFLQILSGNHKVAILKQDEFVTFLVPIPNK